MHSLSRDPLCINHILNAGGVAALSSLAAVKEEFIDGLEVCKEEALMGLRSIIMGSAQGRERVANDGALRVLKAIANNYDDPLSYFAEEAVREFEEIEDREKGRGGVGEEKVRRRRRENIGSQTAKSWVSSDGVSHSDTDVYTRLSEPQVTPFAGVNGRNWQGDFRSVKMDPEKNGSNSFRPQSAIPRSTGMWNSQPVIDGISASESEVKRSDSLSSQKSLRPLSAATILTTQSFVQESAKHTKTLRTQRLAKHDSEPVLLQPPLMLQHPPLLLLQEQHRQMNAGGDLQVQEEKVQPQTQTEPADWHLSSEQRKARDQEYKFQKHQNEKRTRDFKRGTVSDAFSRYKKQQEHAQEQKDHQYEKVRPQTAKLAVQWHHGVSGGNDVNAVVSERPRSALAYSGLTNGIRGQGDSVVTKTYQEHTEMFVGMANTAEQDERDVEKDSPDEVGKNCVEGNENHHEKKEYEIADDSCNPIHEGLGQQHQKQHQQDIITGGTLTIEQDKRDRQKYRMLKEEKEDQDQDSRVSPLSPGRELQQQLHEALSVRTLTAEQERKAIEKYTMEEEDSRHIEGGEYHLQWEESEIPHLDSSIPGQGGLRQRPGSALLEANIFSPLPSIRSRPLSAGSELGTRRKSGDSTINADSSIVSDSRIVSQHRSDDTVATQHSSLTESSSIAKTNRPSRPHTALAGGAGSPHSGRISPVDVSRMPHQPFEASFLQPIIPSFSRPATPGGLMPILERADTSFNKSSDKAPKTWRVGEGDGEEEVGVGGGEGGAEERARASCHLLPLTADDWDADVFSDTSDESPEGSARSTHEQRALGSDVYRVYSSQTPRSSVSVRSQSALSTSSSRKGSRPPSAVSKALFRPQSATLSSPATGKPNFDEFFTDKRRIIHERKVENEKKEQEAARLWAEHDRLFNPPLNPVDCLFNKVVENSHPATRAQSAQSLRSQSARNRLLSRGLPSVAENAATATLSAATTASHSGAATSSQSVVHSGMQVRDGTFDHRNRI